MKKAVINDRNIHLLTQLLYLSLYMSFTCVQKHSGMGGDDFMREISRLEGKSRVCNIIKGM